MTKTRYVIFADPDGVLLDAERYACESAAPALEALRSEGIPLIFCTSKTRVEVEHARAELRNLHPFVVENGAAIFIPRGYFPFALPAWKRTAGYDVIERGVPYREVVAALRRASEKSSCPVRGFSDMSVAELAIRCRMSVGGAQRAKARQYDEPFEVLCESPVRISEMFDRLEEAGLTWTRGPRFYHVRGPHNKGEAAAILAALFRRLDEHVKTVGLGTGPSDLSLLRIVDVPIIIAPPRARPVRGRLRSRARRRGQERAQENVGPQGWNQAVLRLLRGITPAPAC